MIPYVYAESQAGEAYEFGGFLLNHQDGNSYLAKMYLGWRGELLFTLPYTAEKGQGAFILFFIIFPWSCGAAWGISLILAYHLAGPIYPGDALAMYRFSRLLPLATPYAWHFSACLALVWAG
jgi:hypothetical protein